MKKKFFITMLASLLFLVAAPRAHADSIKIDTYKSEDQLTAVIYADKIETPVIGLAFDLYYGNSLSYIDYDEGAFFEQGGEPIYLVTQEKDHKGEKVIVGVTLKRSDALVDLSGSIIALNFEVKNEAPTTLTFKNQVISTLNANGQREDLEIEWVNEEVSFAQPTTQLKTQEEDDDEEIIAEPLQVNTMQLPVPLPIIILLPLPFLCYILLVLIKKRRAKRTFQTARIGFRQPPQIHSP